MKISQQIVRSIIIASFCLIGALSTVQAKTSIDSEQEKINKLVERSAVIQQLYDDGLISRRELEQHTKELTMARSRVAEMQQQIKLAEQQANKKAQLAATADASIAKVTFKKSSITDWSTGIDNIDQLIKQSGQRYGVDPYLIFCVMSQESSFNAAAISVKGARGLMQLMPDTAARFGVSDPFDPAQSIKAGARYLKFLMDKFNGDLALTLAGYNAGEGTVIKYGNRIPPYSETKNYVRNISLRYLGQT